ncbi:MAG: hypothetical protein II008_11270 [Oscillospiraceae bacterium]|nr:hypothetical protein [Oscillospiraceae bacterium]
MADNEDDATTVTKKSEEEEIDLFDAVSDAEEARRNALAEALKAQQKKKSKLINPLEVFALLDDIGLADYEPTFKWEEADASEKQVKALENFGIDAEGISKGYACKILDKLIDRSQDKKATIKQVRTLIRFGYSPVDWSFEQASNKLNQLAAVGWKRWKLHD